MPEIWTGWYVWDGTVTCAGRSCDPQAIVAFLPALGREHLEAKREERPVTLYRATLRLRIEQEREDHEWLVRYADRHGDWVDLATLRAGDHALDVTDLYSFGINVVVIEAQGFPPPVIGPAPVISFRARLEIGLYASYGA